MAAAGQPGAAANAARPPPQSAKKEGSLDMGALLAMKRGGSKLNSMLEPSARLNVFRDEARLQLPCSPCLG